MTVYPPTRLRRPAGEWWPGVAFVAAVSVLVAWLARWGPDWPAQEFRAWIGGHDGLSLLTMRWYGGRRSPATRSLPPVRRDARAGLGVCSPAWPPRGPPPGSLRFEPVGAPAFHFAVRSACPEPADRPAAIPVRHRLRPRGGPGAHRPAPGGSLPRWGAGSLASPLSGAFLLLVRPALAGHVRAAARARWPRRCWDWSSQCRWAARAARSPARGSHAGVAGFLLSPSWCSRQSRRGPAFFAL